MKNIFIPYQKSLLLSVVTTILLLSCNKKDIFVDASYPDQQIGIAQAAVATLGPGANGVYRVAANRVGGDFKFKVDIPASKVNISMGIIRSGIKLDGAIEANLVIAGEDTINTLKAPGLVMPTTTEILPAAAFTLPPTVTVQNGKATGEFNLALDLNFLVANITRKYAVAIGLSSSKNGLVNSKLSIAVVYIDPAVILLPTANFGVAIDGPTKTVEFLNSSINGVTFSWNYGDGSPVVTTPFPRHTYTTAGSYIVSLTTTGVTGVTSVRTTTIVIP